MLPEMSNLIVREMIFLQLMVKGLSFLDASNEHETAWMASILVHIQDKAPS
jgi:hypothetical protein